MARCVGVGLLLCWTALLPALGCDRAGEAPGEDDALRALAMSHGARALTAPEETHSADKVELGRMLFFEPALSGNQDTSCATCHHPAFGMGDGRALSVGAGGAGGVGPARVLGEGREHAPRNAPSILNLNDPAWKVQFWDGRVEMFVSGSVRTPVTGAAPRGLESVIAVQSMFPVLSRDEMRGERGDQAIDGSQNELAAYYDSEQSRIWDALMVRLLAYEGYQDLFARAYPGVDAQALGFEHAANAMAAFEEQEFALVNSPWDRFLRGEDEAMSAQAKRGAKLFFGDGGCVSCHSGPLLSDQGFYNLAVPQLGPGKGADKPLDLGRARVSMDPADNFKFRTPSLRHVAYTAPYMHNGAYVTLEQAIRHHTRPEQMLRGYTDAALEDEALKGTVQAAATLHDRMLATLSEELSVVPDLSDEQVDDLKAFLMACGDPAVEQLERLLPETLPSGLTVDRVKE